MGETEERVGWFADPANAWDTSHGVPHTVDEYTGGEFDGAAASQARTGGGGGAALPARPVSRQRREKLGVEGGRSSPRQTAMFNIAWAGSRVL